VTEDELCFKREIWLEVGTERRQVVQWHYKGRWPADNGYEVNNIGNLKKLKKF
jgi:hypothetical protein